IVYLFCGRSGKQIISSARCTQFPDEPAQNRRRGSGTIGSRPPSSYLIYHPSSGPHIHEERRFPRRPVKVDPRGIAPVDVPRVPSEHVRSSKKRTGPVSSSAGGCCPPPFPLFPPPLFPPPLFPPPPPELPLPELLPPLPPLPPLLLVGFRLFFCAASRAACAAAWAAASAAFCASASAWDVLSLVTASRYCVSRSLIFLYAGSTATTGVTPAAVGAAGVSAVSAVAVAVTVSFSPCPAEE